MSPVERLLRDPVGVFDRLEIPYAVMGGIAVRAHGLPRPTYDVDMTISIERDSLESLLQTIDALGYHVGHVGDVPHVRATTFVDGRALSADIFMCDTPFQESLMARRVRVRVGGFEMWLVSPEDLLLLKLLASRPRDLADVEEVLVMQPAIDHDYIHEWAAELDIADALERALEPSQGGP